MFQHSVVQVLFGNDLFELTVFIFQLFETLGFAGFHAAILGLPAMESRFADTESLKYRSGIRYVAEV